MSGEEGKKSLFGRFMALFGRRGAGKAADVSYEPMFARFLDGLDKNSAEYIGAARVAAMCGEAVNVTKRRLELTERLRRMGNELYELERISRLSNGDAAKLKSLVDRYISLTNEKESLRNQLTGFDRPLSYMRRIEGEANAAVPEITHAEGRQRVFRNDLALLESEKYALENERHSMASALTFTRRFGLALVFVSGALLIGLGYLFLYMNQNVLTAGVIFMTALILAAVGIFAFRRRIRFELVLNQKKLKRASEIINKKTVIYSHYTNFLNFEYKKYKVRSAEMLKDTLSEFELYKHIDARLDSVRNILYQTEKEIQDFLKDRKLSDIMSAVESFAATVDLGDKQARYNELIRDRASAESGLRLLEKQHGDLWDKLAVYQELNTGDVAVRMIKACMDETGRLVERGA